MATYTPMIQQYLQIKADYPDAILFFRLGDFYEMFFEDAELASRLLEITLTGRDGGTEERIPMCGVPYHSANSYIHKLIEKGYKVAICEQVEDPKQAKGVVKREVTRVITPGTIMDGKLVESKANNYIASIFLLQHSNQFGISISDISTGEFYSTIIEEDFDHVIHELILYQPSEIVLSKKLIEFESVLKQYLETNLTWLDDEITDQQNYYKNLVYEQFQNVKEPLEAIIFSAGMLLDYLHKTQRQKLIHFNELQIYEAKHYLILDPFSRRNLELTETSRDHSKKGSLLWLLDQTETSMGSRLLRRWLEKPLLSKVAIEERLNSVQALYENPLVRDELKDLLREIYDIERIVSRISYGNASARDLYSLKQSLEKIPRLRQVLVENKIDPLIQMMGEFDQCTDIYSLIDESIVDDPPIGLKEGGIIKRGYHPKLDAYYRASTEGKQWLQDMERREREITGIKSLKVGFNKVFGYYIEVTKSNLAQVPTDRYIRKQTLANGERFITEELKEKESQILEAEEKMQELEYQIFTEVRERIANQNPRLQRLAQQIAIIDVLLSFAKVSSMNGYVRPQFNQEGRIRIRQGRHPVIEFVQKETPYIPNDVELDQESQQILLITGPNMAGKSTYMRQIALIIIMAQIGCFVPAESANIAITDRIFTRIGAGDDLTSGHSTFMVEMLETKQAILQATTNSLILLDEIGRGTSTYDGMALAQAIIEYIHDHVHAKTLFSTHYHELTSLADRFSRIQNIHVNVMEKDGKVVFLHKIEKGKADRSYGIYVAELAGLPYEVIENAKRILRNYESKARNLKNDGKEKAVQLVLFPLQAENNQLSQTNESRINKEYDKEIIQQILSLDLLNMTPMEGFQILYEIQKRLRK
ncbi:DNA mismatch repair protein MutS [Tepidibacillus fermentans]|uniref:DNA mismatch repair protein MutS n=1 Tax=Tepidibacillus fermentans TaxID=1281767 RepID=A0A4R3KHT1_9BACI|nr:DNA mismatch repair protein MutS [Tepidibacillus fermentans]TCS83037.1 DNA mismatch repair protein MutS [Tepidibacillus fermentans]